MKSYKALFSNSLGHIPAYRHAAAHSHHLRPDVLRDAELRCVEDAFRLADKKWQTIFADIYPRAQAHIARILNTGQPQNVVFAPTTHEFLMRLLSCLPQDRPQRILTTDSEFHSANRQFRRLEEAGVATVTRVVTEPFATFPERFAAEAGKGEADLVFFSHVFFNSGYVIPDLGVLVNEVPDKDTLIVVDGYHSFMALPVDLSAIRDRAFYMAGGYKYAMAGESCCFLHAPAGYGPRPVNTGWFAGFSAMEGPQGGLVAYAGDGSRFAGGTMEPAGLYRLNEVQDLLEKEDVQVGAIHERVKALQEQFLTRLEESAVSLLGKEILVTCEAGSRGNFLTFRTEQAGAVHDVLMQAGLVTDYRDDRLRFGFGLYHEPDDIDRMVALMEESLG